MTFQQIYTEAINLRFNGNATKLAQVKNWVNQAEIALWNSADWTFKRMPAVVVTVGSSGAMAEPSDFDRAVRVWDPRGFEVPYMNVEDFEDTYVAPVPVPTGNAEFYTVYDRLGTNGGVFVGPPEASALYKLAYQRRYSKRNGGGGIVQGVMSSDTDTPLWDSEHHYILVPWAIRMGKYLEDDPTGTLTEQVLEGLGEKSLFAAMLEQHANKGTKRVPRIWGASTGFAAS